MGAITRDGRAWVPRHLDSIDPDACIGCGRCFKVCGRGVMGPVDREVDDDEEECVTTVMDVVDAGACIGCQACARVCARQAHTHATA